MVAQHGTLHFVGDGAFLVMSLPASAFPFADADHDGRLSAAELQWHQAAITAAVQADLRLLDATGPRPLEGLMFTLSPAEEAPGTEGRELVVLGRFALAQVDGPFQFELSRFSSGGSEQVTFTRGTASQLVFFTPERTTSALFPSAGALFVEHVRLGVEHILTGFDHLLFLLVVLAAGGGWRRIALALTCFTLGHAATLALSVLGGVSAPASVVEPAIAATIVGMALFDWRSRARGVDPGARLVLVFGCALIHGLGLASSLKELGIDRQHLAPVLVGFNVGIELGQLAVSLVAALTALLLTRVVGAARAERGQWVPSAVAILVGGVWLVERLTSGR
jgi:hypothetical protein